ncbi:hypothetical protein [Nocardia africana]|uniref:Uncharacterized protein n=1 Tax=Nocardia africana TaxID=134964 RepID=A0A378WWG0_9NOCA|nr:hypothetical protein [Nocardia africana]MCC3313644.1 hypothetical protein [Nocardia africana]SUA44975.1 Uncharacterised protein [Nocardia africana]
MALTDTGANRWDHFPDLNLTGFLVQLAQRSLQSTVMPLDAIELPATPSLTPVNS